ncbi:hypothetical protein S40293_07066 [Stachybotrys chartarum IBT 40293]|nr:hypothetical protein S40293_07066 [Stachybotrys chartarum IBT 40293]
MQRCRNFDRLESRLTGIEGELFWLTSRLKAESGFFQQRTPSSDSVGLSSDDIRSVDQSGLSATYHKPKVSERVVRGHDNQGDQYHGPGTLVSLCYDLKETLVQKDILGESPESPSSGSSNSKSTATAKMHDPPEIHGKKAKCADLMDRICATASFEAQIPLADPVAIRLPPKQLLLMVIPQYLSNVDYTTDLFVEPHLAANIERIYLRPPTPANDAWAICFNTIILLVLDTEDVRQGNDPLARSQFSLPFFQVTQAAFQQAHLLTTPRLINIQALALLSIVAEKYYPAAKGGAIFAQACLLARRAGLHQDLHLPEDEVSPDEVCERFKTFRSLHLRDKTLALSWASISWLPKPDRNQSLRLLSSAVTNPQISERVRLADIQERLYKYLYTETHQNSSRAAVELVAIDRDLENWNLEHGKYRLPLTSSHEAELQLTFLATRMLAYMCSDDESHRRIIVHDARASCLILLIAYKKHDDTIVKMLQSLYSPSITDSGNELIDHTAKATMPSAYMGRLTPLINSFPISAFFQLTKHVMQSQTSADDIDNHEGRYTDLELLRQVHHCMMEANSRTQSQNRASQNERTFALLFDLIDLVKNPEFDDTSPPSDGIPPRVSYTRPTAGTNLGSGSDDGDFLTRFTPLSGDISWGMLDASYEYQELGSGQEMEREKRKRLRTGDRDLINTGSRIVPLDSDEADMWPQIYLNLFAPC